MPLPLSHSMAGLGLHVAADRGGTGAGWRLLAAVVVANAPDLDMIPGLLIGEPNRFHQGPTHSFGVAVLVGLVVWIGARLRWPGRSGSPSRPLTAAALAALLWGSHVLLDLCTEDLSEPVGVPALWPVSGRRFQLLPLFQRTDKLVGSGGVDDFLLSLLTWHNLGALAWEAAIMAPPVVLALWWARRRAARS